LLKAQAHSDSRGFLCVVLATSPFAAMDTEVATLITSEGSNRGGEVSSGRFRCPRQAVFACAAVTAVVLLGVTCGNHRNAVSVAVSDASKPFIPKVMKDEDLNLFNPASIKHLTIELNPGTLRGSKQELARLICPQDAAAKMTCRMDCEVDHSKHPRLGSLSCKAPYCPWRGAELVYEDKAWKIKVSGKSGNAELSIPSDHSALPPYAGMWSGHADVTWPTEHYQGELSIKLHHGKEAVGKWQFLHCIPGDGKKIKFEAGFESSSGSEKGADFDQKLATSFSADQSVDCYFASASLHEEVSAEARKNLHKNFKDAMQTTSKVTVEDDFSPKQDDPRCLWQWVWKVHDYDVVDRNHGFDHQVGALMTTNYVLTSGLWEPPLCLPGGGDDRSLQNCHAGYELE